MMDSAGRKWCTGDGLYGGSAISDSVAQPLYSESECGSNASSCKDD